MNVKITHSVSEAANTAKIYTIKEAEKIRIELDKQFKTKICTPEQVIVIYDLLTKYKLLSGKEYKITFEENTIV